MTTRDPGLEDPMPTHPRVTAALLMIAVVLVIVVLAVISTLNHG